MSAFHQSAPTVKEHPMSRAQPRPRPRRLPVTKARANLGAVLRHVHEDKVPILLECNGEPVKP
jgi:hypothetical protein